MAIAEVSELKTDVVSTWVHSLGTGAVVQVGRIEIWRDKRERDAQMLC